MSFPIMKVNKIRVKNINTQNCQAILTTSFNSLTFLSDLIDNKNLKIFTLGLSSACYARNIGFKNVIDCDGDGDKMVSTILRKTRNDKGKIIYAGAKNISVNIPHILRNKGYEVDRISLYSTTKIREFSSQFLNMVKNAEVAWIVLLSQKGAQYFYKIFDKKFQLKDKKAIKYACLSAKIASELKSKDYKIFFPEKPSINQIENLITNYEKNHGN